MKRKQYGKHFAYSLDLGHKIIPWELRFVNLEILPLIPCTLTKHNGKNELFYHTTHLMPISQVLQQTVVSRLEWLDQVLIVIRQLIEEDYLDYRKVVLHTEDIWVDVKNKKVYLTYLPVELDDNLQVSQQLQQLLSSLLETKIAMDMDQVLSQDILWVHQWIKEQIKINK